MAMIGLLGSRSAADLNAAEAASTRASSFTGNVMGRSPCSLRTAKVRPSSDPSRTTTGISEAFAHAGSGESTMPSLSPKCCIVYWLVLSAHSSTPDGVL